MIHGHGDDIQGELIANFSSNVWYDADNSALYQYLCSVMNSVNRYPEPDASSLIKKLAQHLTVDPTEILVTNGSTEAFYFIANVFYCGFSIVSSPGFSEYKDACYVHNHNVLECGCTELGKNIEKNQPDLVWICHPNNPDGYSYSVDTIKRWMKQYPETVFIVDQAYADFTQQEVFRADDIHSHPNLILTFSMTKKYAIPGLRLGYIVASDALINKIRNCFIPWSVNTLAIEAGKYFLKHPVNFNLVDWLDRTHFLQRKIQEIDGLEVCASSTPFFLIKLSKGKAILLKNFLMERGILVRDATNFSLLEGEYIRVCTQSELHNQLLIDALKSWSLIH